MKLSIPSGTTSKRIGLFIQDSSSTTGAGLTGLAFNTSSLVCYSWIDTDGNAGGTSQTLATATKGTWTTIGFVEKDSTNMPGWYEFGIPNALIAAGVKWAILHFKGATNMAPLPVEIEVTATSNQDAVRGGMTALPNANANAAGGLPISSAGALDLDEMNVDIEAIQTSTAGLTFTVANQVDVNVLDWKSATAPAMTGDAFARLGAPAGASIAADIAEVEGETDTLLTNTTGITFTVANQVDVNVVDWKGSAAPAMTGDAFARLGAPTGASIAADIQEIEAETDTLLAGVTVTTNNDKTGYGITSNVKTNQALATFPFLMTDSTNHAPSTGLTVTCTRSIDGAAFGAGTLANVTELANGIYTVDFGAGDLNGKNIILKATAAASDTRFERIVTQP